MAYACDAGRALIDRRLYLPASWARDRDRCAAAGVPTDVAFATKPRLALQMIGNAVAAKPPAGWVAADEVYGNDPAFRAGVADLGLGYVLAVACDHHVTLSHGAIRTRVDQLAATLPDTAWQRYSARVGSKGPRWYAWAWVDLAGDAGPEHTLLIRRNTTTGELAFYGFESLAVGGPWRGSGHRATSAGRARSMRLTSARMVESSKIRPSSR